MSKSMTKRIEAQSQLFVGDRVRKTGGDYTFVGTIVSLFTKRGGACRVVVEDGRGLLLIMNETQLEKIPLSAAEFVRNDSDYPD